MSNENENIPEEFKGKTASEAVGILKNAQEEQKKIIAGVKATADSTDEKVDRLQSELRKVREGMQASAINANKNSFADTKLGAGRYAGQLSVTEASYMMKLVDSVLAAKTAGKDVPFNEETLTRMVNGLAEGLRNVDEVYGISERFNISDQSRQTGRAFNARVAQWLPNAIINDSDVGGALIDEVTPETWRAMDPLNPVASLFTQWFLTSDSTRRFPKQLTGGRARPGGTQGSIPTSIDQDLTYTSLVTEELEFPVNYSLSVEEDSFIDFGREAVVEILAAWNNSIDWLILNADATSANTGNVNSDDKIINKTDATDFALAVFNNKCAGLRKRALSHASKSTTAVSSLGVSTYMNVRNALVGLRRDNLAFIVDPRTMAKTLVLDEVETVEKFGNRATVLTGQLGSIYGIPLIESDQMPLTDADGKANLGTGKANNTKGTILCVATDYYRRGVRRPLQTHVEARPLYRDFWILTTSKWGFVSREDGTDGTPVSAATTVNGQFNIA